MNSINKFFDSENIPYLNIAIKIEKDDENNIKKIPIGLPKGYNDLSIEEIKEIRDSKKILLYDEEDIPAFCGFIGKTENIYCIDIDDENIKNIQDYINILKKNLKNNDEIFNILSSLPYIRGNTRGIHIYVKLSNVDKKDIGVDMLNFIKGDFLRKMMWEKKDKEVFNYSQKMKIYDYKDIKVLINTEKKSQHEFLNDSNDTIDISELKDINDDEEIINIIKYISIQRFDDTQQWISMAYAFKKAGVSFELFNKYSMTSSKYDFKACKDLWNSPNIASLKSDRKNLALLRFFAKKDNATEYIKSINKNKLIDNAIDNNNINLDNLDDDLNNCIKINLDKLDYELLKDHIIKFFSDVNIKTFSILSAYGTGKSTLLKKILDVYNPKRILFLSYRRSLTSDIYSKFENYKFADYRNDDILSDRIIIQPESIQKLFYNSEHLQHYDLVIMDESESILSQFSSNSTFKGLNKRSFNIFNKILSHPKTKIIALDGDLGERSYNYFNLLGNSINIKNTFKNESKTYSFIEDEELFNNNIISDLEKKIKVSVASMSARYLERLQSFILSKNDKIKILKITSLTDDNLKSDVLSNINEKIKQYDLFLYSPSVEAGVDIDKVEFKQYGVVCPLSCSSRSFRQMLARTRKVINKNIFILNVGLHYSPITQKDFWNFEDVEKFMSAYGVINNELEENIFNDDLGTNIEIRKTPYNLIYTYNKLEQLNNTNTFFLQNLFNQLNKNGHKLEYEKKEKKEKKEIDKTTTMRHKILMAENITEAKFTELMIKQKTEKATEKDKIEINRHLYQKSLSVFDLTDEMLKKFDLSSISHHLSLIDKDLVKLEDGINYVEQHKKIDFIISSIKALGFDGIYDNYNYIQKWKLENNYNSICENSLMFRQWEEVKVLFKFDKRKLKPTDLRQYISSLNTMMGNYHVRINNTKFFIVNEENIRTSQCCYYIEILNNIDDIIYNKYLDSLDKKIRNILISNIKYCIKRFNKKLDDYNNKIIKKNDSHILVINNQIERLNNILSNFEK